MRPRSGVIGGRTLALSGQDYPVREKAKSTNPVFCLDEVDKMSTDFRGDLLRRCSKSSTPNRMSLSMIITST